MTLSKERPCPFRGKAKGEPSSPIVNRYIHSAEFTHKAIPKSKDENGPPPPSLNHRIRTATHRFVITLYTRHLRSHFLSQTRRERTISRYNLLYAGNTKGISHLPPPRVTSFKPRNDHPPVSTPINSVFHQS